MRVHMKYTYTHAFILVCMFLYASMCNAPLAPLIKCQCEIVVVVVVIHAHMLPTRSHALALSHYLSLMKLLFWGGNAKEMRLAKPIEFV